MDEATITPLAVPSDARTLMVLGGTFDPVHVGHVQPVTEARTLAGLHDAWLVYVPAARSPHKTDNPIAPDADRVEMLRLAIAEVGRAVVWTDEVVRAGGPSYTIETLRRLRRLRPEATLRLVIGADQAVALHRWREPREILAIAPPLIMLRGGVLGSGEAVARSIRGTGVWSDAEAETLARGIVEVTPRDVSASVVRKSLAGGDIAFAKGLLHPRVLDYVESRVLYRT